MRFSAILLFLSVMVSGMVLSQDIPRSRLILRETARKAELGDPEALYQMSVVYSRGFDSIPQDIQKSDSLLKRAAESGHISAANLLAYRLMEGRDIEPDTIEAVRLFEIAADAGDRKAQSNLGYLLVNGIGVEPDPAKGAYWLELASEGGLAMAQSMLGDLYRDGKGVEVDTLQAEAHYRAALERGLPDAGSKLYDVRRNEIKAFSDVEKLKEALIYYRYNALPPAIKIITEIEESPDTIVRAHAKAVLGDAYARSYGVKYDYAKSVEYLYEAATLGNPSAAFMIGEMLDMLPDALNQIISEDSPADYRYAQYWYNVASQSGITDAAEASRRLKNPQLP